MLALFVFIWAFSFIDQMGKRARRPDLSAHLILSAPGEDVEEAIAQVLRPKAELSQNQTTKTQVDEIDRQIKELEAVKRGYESRAMRHEDQAARLQFMDRAVLETRRHLELAEENWAKAQRVQEEIDRLQGERKKLLSTG